MTSRSIVGILDYRSGNIRSVVNAVESVGSLAHLVRNCDDFRGCSHLILPGVGAFGFCAQRLRASGMLQALEEWALARGRPLLGICVGMQLLADYSEELGRHDGLGWIGGSVTRLQRAAESSIRIPHVGWNEVVFRESFGQFAAGAVDDFYFDHSFAYQSPVRGKELAICSHGREFSAIVSRDNIVAVQFHPEKSQAAGVRFLKSFLAI
jgi:imidazole glycerol-phosphate synthase subunit HisH